jgi:hypothetical protein
MEGVDASLYVAATASTENGKKLWFGLHSYVEIKISGLFLCASNELMFLLKDLSTKSVKGLSLTFEGVDNIHCRYCLSAGVLSVGDRITDDVLEEDLEDTTGFFVDQSRNTLDTTSTRKTTDSRLGDTLDIITKDLSVTLGASLSESLSSFTSARHVELIFM